MPHPMHRRRLLLATLAGIATVPAARAHHGWSSFDTGRPLYVEGRVGKVMWRNPHAEFELELPENPRLPPDLAERVLPAQAANLDGAALLRSARLPTRSDRRWHIELAPLSRLQAWQVAPLASGQTVAVLGYTFVGEKGDAVLRAEYLFVGGKAYGLRSSPA